MAKQIKKTKSGEDRVMPGGRPPRYYLEQSVELAMQVYEDAGGNASLDELAALTKNTQKSSSFVAKLNTLKSYGLVVADEQRVRLSEIGEQIATPEDPADKNAGLKSAFLNIESFKVVYDKFIGKLLPQGEFLKNAFSNQENIPKQLADEWADHFVNSGKYAGLLMDRGDGKLQVRGMASDKVSSAGAKEPVKQYVEDKADVYVEPPRREQPLVVAASKTPYDFLVEIFKGAEMNEEEEAAVFTLFRFLKKQQLGTKSKPVTNDSESSSA